MTRPDNSDGLVSLVQRVGRSGDGERVSVADIVTEIGDDAFPPLLLVPALVLISPLSGVPGMSITFGLIMTLIAVQMVLRRRHVWLPGFLMRRTIEKTRLEKSMRVLVKPAGWVDRVTGERLAWLVRGPMETIPACIILAAAMLIPFLEIVPFSSTVVSTAIALFALSILVEDGLLFIVGLVMLGAGGYLIWSFVG